MKVLLTGGTGFVGSHVARALQAAGHRLRLFVRNPTKLDSVLKPRGVAVDDYAVGDISDAAAVRNALQGCDAVVHAAASLYGGADVLEANVAGVRNAVGAGVELGLDPVIYISTVAAMFPPPGDVIRVDDPIVNLKTTYGRSKAEGERMAREYQQSGAPVVTVYPAGVWGPDDPALGEPLKGLRDALRFGWPLTGNGGVSIIDVRDLAQLIVAALEPGRGARRFMGAGHFVTWPQLADICDELTQRPARRVHMPDAVLHGIGRIVDVIRAVVPFEYPLTHEATLVMTNFVPCDSQETIERLGIEFRPTTETIRDAIRWLYEQGQLSAKVAGKLAD